MGTVESIILGIVQGATEFLPVSSTGHLVLARFFLDVHDANALAFDAMLHLATAAAVIVYFRKDLWLLTQTALRKLSRLPVNQRELVLLYALIAGTIPAVVFGLLLESYMETLFREPVLVAGVLVAGSFLFIVAEVMYLKYPRNDDITVRKGIIVGLFQSLALIPGMSRSGASIVGGMFLGLSRHQAARFAFLLAVPVILGAGAKKFLELATSNVDVSWQPIMVGAGVAFVVGILAIHFMLSFVRRYSLWPFIWYRIVLAGVVVFLVMGM